ncbi:MAG: putative membrane protein, partial [Pseudohongiellaceae bacterium]
GGDEQSTGATEQLVRVSFVPEVEGDVDLRIVVAPLPGEADDVNNVDRRMLRVEPGRIKVLYIEGYPRYEYRFLMTSLLRVPNMEVQCFLTSASPDFIQESSAGVASLKSIPQSLDWLLENYHVIILGDVHPQDLGKNYAAVLGNFKSFVEQGGGLLMLAGNRYAPREYRDTPLADILPVLIGDPETEARRVLAPGQPFRPVLARPRDPHEIVSLDPDVDRNRALWEDEGGLAPLTWYYPAAKLRSTAEALLTHPTDGNEHGPYVLLSTMYYPQGRTAFLASDETWRWRFRYLETYREPFWRGLIRYLALNRLRRSDYRFDLSSDLSSYSIGERIGLVARVRDDEFDALRTESFEVSYISPDGEQDVLSLSREVDGMFVGSLLAGEPGPYRFWLVDPNDPTQPRSPRIVTVTTPTLETDDAVLDELLLERIAARTGGRYAPLQDVSALLAVFQDPPRERPLDEPDREEIWAGFPQLSLLVLLLAGEWILRKRGNLV